MRTTRRAALNMFDVLYNATGYDQWPYTGACSLPAHGWPGGYSITYYFDDGEACCADCATKRMHSFRAYLVLSALNPILETEDEDGDTIYTTCDVLDTMAYDHDGLATEPRDVPTMYDINWEGSDEYCADCNKRMPSEYGDSEDSEDAEDA